MNKVIYKQFDTKATSIDEVNYTITFKVSDSKVDRQGEIVSQKDWQMDNYMANPVLLFGHDPSKPEYVIGKCIEMIYSAAEDCHYGTYKLDADFNPTALLIWNQLVAGTLRTVSLGFITHSYELEEDVRVLGEIEPLETSIVPIPANAGALAKAYKAGKLNADDAKFLVKAMSEEAQRITTELKEGKKDKSMTEEQGKTLIDTVEKLTAIVTAQDEKIAALTERLPEAETEEQKTARETAEAQAAAEKEAADKKAKEDENVANGLNPDGSAKSGTDGDQGGAGSEEFTDDTELTPEQEAAMDADLEATLHELEPANQ